MSEAIHYLIGLISGALVKLVDDLEDVEHSKGGCKYLLSIIYGLGIGFLISKASFSTLFLAVLIGQIVAGKVDKASHMVGVVVITGVVVAFGISTVIEMSSFIIFLILAVLDEQEWLGKFSSYRLWVKLGSLIYAIVFGRYDYFLSIMLFDGGYLFVEKSSGARKICR